MTCPNVLPRFAPRRRPLAFAAMAALLLIVPAVSGCSKNSSSNSSSEAPASASDPVIARVNGVDITQGDLALAEEDVGGEMQAASPEAKREQLISYLADIIMVTQAAEKKNLADNPDFKRRLAFLRNKLLMGYELQQEAKTALTDEALHQTYDEAVRSLAGQEEVRARHILVEGEDEAKAILEQLKGGADFATLAKEKSKDPGAAEGGDLGYFTKDQMVPEFADVAFKMYPGQLSNPVKTQFGWHVIKVEDRRTKQPPEFDKVKDQIEAFLTRKAQTDFITKLRQNAKIERLDKPAEQNKPVGQNNPAEPKKN
jgi:peptidyl-prolyl cis-trans isomerase C